MFSFVLEFWLYFFLVTPHKVGGYHHLAVAGAAQLPRRQAKGWQSGIPSGGHPQIPDRLTARCRYGIRINGEDYVKS